MRTASGVNQDVQGDRVRVWNNLVPRWDGIRQRSKPVSVEVGVFVGEVEL
jgi:hypothetical protein